MRHTALISMVVVVACAAGCATAATPAPPNWPAQFVTTIHTGMRDGNGAWTNRTATWYYDASNQLFTKDRTDVDVEFADCNKQQVCYFSGSSCSCMNSTAAGGYYCPLPNNGFQEAFATFGTPTYMGEDGGEYEWEFPNTGITYYDSVSDRTPVRMQLQVGSVQQVDVYTGFQATAPPKSKLTPPSSCH